MATPLVVGAVLGGAVGAVAVAASTDPTHSNEYRALQAKVSDAQASVEAANTAAAAAQDSASSAEAAASSSASSLAAEASASAATLSAQAAAVQSSAAALSAAQAAVNANSISEGTWRVGSDVQPGTYRTTAAVGGDCYWEIDNASGGIVKNDIVTGGFPTVTLSPGQTFVTERCGNWLKQ